MTGDQAFFSATPHLWNALHDHLRAPQTTESFKKRLKTFLFSRSYDFLIHHAFDVWMCVALKLVAQEELLLSVFNSDAKCLYPSIDKLLCPSFFDALICST